MNAPIRANTTEPAIQLLSLSQAASSLGIGIRTLQEQVAERKIPVVRIGRRTLFEIHDLKAFIESSKIKAIGWKAIKQ